jgi:hypothetical protein
MDDTSLDLTRAWGMRRAVVRGTVGPVRDREPDLGTPGAEVA